MSNSEDYQDILSTEDCALGAFDKNVIIGAAMNYGVEQIKNFILSFRKYNKFDDVILIYNMNQASQIEDFAKRHNIKLVGFDPFDRLPIHVVASRFLKYRSIVHENVDYKHYFLTDIRDVFFQSNPFVNLPENEYLYMFTEDPAITIDIEEHHTRMISRLFGESELYRFKDKKIICSGTILGTRQKMLNFLNVFMQYLLQIQNRNPKICYEMLLDQVITNHACYFQKQLESEIQIKMNGDIVGTIGHCITHPDHSGDMKLIGDTIYLDGKIPPVIHQYDRSPEFFKHFSELYSNVD